MNWKQKLEKLIQLEDKEEPSYVDITQMRSDALSWNSCAVADKILSIDQDWGELYEEQQDIITEFYPKLRHLGTEFYDRVVNNDYKEALDLYNRIQKHRINDANMKSRINEQLIGYA